MSCAAFTFLGIYAAIAGKGGEWVVRGSIGLAVLFGMWAAYRAWKTQYDKAATERPDLRLEVHGVFSQSTEMHTLVVLSIRIINRGAPSAVLGYRVAARGRGIDQQAKLLVLRNSEDDSNEVSFKMTNGYVFTINGDDAIHNRTSSPIPRGGFVAGRLSVLLDGHWHNQILSGETKLTVTITDFQQRDTVCEFVGTGKTEMPTFLLGEPIADDNRSMEVRVAQQFRPKLPRNRRRRKKRK